MKTMGGNTFYTNAEACAYEILQQKLMSEAQKSAQQTFMELSALKSLFSQGQFIYCIPFGGLGHVNNQMPFPFHLMPPMQHVHPMPPAPPPVCAQEPGVMSTSDPNCPLVPSPNPPPNNSATYPPHPPPQPSPPPPPHPNLNQQSIVRINVKNPQNKIPANKPDECNIGKDGIDVTIDLREYLPAEISLDVEEKSIEIKACHVHPHGTKTFARRYDLPACIVLDSVRCILSHDGYLLFSAAWIKME